MSITGAQLREMSKTASRSADLHSGCHFDDQQLCHKVPNSILTIAYNSTDDERIKKDIIAFNYSHDNIIASTNNSEHSKMERALKSNSANRAQFRQKSDMMGTALLKLHLYNDYAFKTCAHIMRTIANESTQYKELVGLFDMRRFTSSQVKAVIRQCQ
jgi:hypothetical protein